MLKSVRARRLCHFMSRYVMFTYVPVAQPVTFEQNWIETHPWRKNHSHYQKSRAVHDFIYNGNVFSYIFAINEIVNNIIECH